MTTSSDASSSTTRRGGVWALDPERLSHYDVPRPVCDIIIPALNEARSITKVLADIPRLWVRDIIVVDNGSSDATPRLAEDAGATVVHEPQRGYGAACLAGLAHIRHDPPEVVAFLDADYSDFPEELPRVLAPIALNDAEFVVGSRMIGQRTRGALLPQALFGNRLASALIYGITGYRFTDLGPFRAIRWDALEQLHMEDENYGWTVEMQLKAGFAGLSCVEVPVSYRERIGVSKVTGTLKGTVMASYKILYTIVRYALTHPQHQMG